MPSSNFAKPAALAAFVGCFGCSGASPQPAECPDVDEVPDKCVDQLRVTNAQGCLAPWLEKEIAYWKIGLGVWAEAIVERKQATRADFQRVVRFAISVAADGTVLEVQPVDEPPLPAEMKKAMQLLKTMTLVHSPNRQCSAVADWDASCAFLQHRQ